MHCFTAIRSSLAPGREWRRDEKDRDGGWTLPFTPSDPDDHLPVYLPAPPLLQPSCRLSSCTLSTSSTLLSTFCPMPASPFHSSSSLPLSLSSPPRQLSSSFLPFHTSLSILYLWSFCTFVSVTKKKPQPSLTLNLSSPAFFYSSVLNIYRVQIKSSRMTQWIRSLFPSRITGCSNSKGGSDILFLSVVYSPSLIHTHTKSWNSSHRELRQHLSACPSLRLQPSDFYLFIFL